MPESWRKYLLGLLLILGVGLFVGWLYGRPEVGLLVAALLALAWQVRQLLAFDRALRTRNFDAFRYGDGIWQQIFSRFDFETQRSLRHKQRYRGLLREIRKSTNAMPDAAVVIDRRSEIVMCNRAAKSLLGLRPKKDRGQRIDNILRDQGLTRLLSGEDEDSTVDMPSPVRVGDWLNCRIVPYGADQRLLLFRDITERLKLAKMRRDFVANASHELRSPLTVISGYLDGVDESEYPVGWEKPFARMQAQARRMNQVISELLELSRLEIAGRANRENAVDVAALIRAAARNADESDGAPRIKTRIDDDLLLLGNATQIESVITNLLSNAIRHTPADGKINLTWRKVKDAVVIDVSDTGEGIAPEHVARVTERFFRVDKGRARSDGGVGLGLAIVKHILSRHDAELIIDSRPGEGSRFRCRFPAERSIRRVSERAAG